MLRLRTYICISLIGLRDENHKVITALNIRFIRRGGCYSIGRRQDEVSCHAENEIDK